LLLCSGEKGWQNSLPEIGKEETMVKGRKKAKKKLQKGKKLEAKKPLFMGLGKGSLTGTASAGKEYLQVDFKETLIS
jgi:hypothetical protein